MLLSPSPHHAARLVGARSPGPPHLATRLASGAVARRQQQARHSSGSRRSSNDLLASRSSSGDADTSAAAPTPAAPPAGPARLSSRKPAAFNDEVPEQLFYEGSASNAELAISLLLAATLVYIPITIAVIGKRLWIKWRFSNKRVTIINSSPLFAKQVEVSYRNVKEIRTAPRAFGLWGDAVIFLKDGDRLEITGLENFREIERHIVSCITDPS